MKHIVFRNPTRPRRKARRSSNSPSAAVRRKISLAVKRANAARKASGPRRAVARRVSRRAVSTVRRARRSVARVVRRSIRRRRSGGSFGGMSIKGIFSKDNLLMAGGVVASQVAVSYIFSNYGSKLPGVTGANGVVNKTALAAYQVGIPILAGYLLRKAQPKLAVGLVVGGIASGLSTIVSQVSIPKASTTTATATTNAYLSPGSGKPVPAYQATNVFRGPVSPFNNGAGPSAFKRGAFSR